MKVKEYEFEALNWPPPKDLQGKDGYLFGFDNEYQPYIIRWETLTKCWCATTLENSLITNSSADLRYFDGKEVDAIIKWYAEAPVQRSMITDLT